MILQSTPQSTKQSFVCAPLRSTLFARTRSMVFSSWKWRWRHGRQCVPSCKTQETGASWTALLCQKDIAFPILPLPLCCMPPSSAFDSTPVLKLLELENAVPTSAFQVGKWVTPELITTLATTEHKNTSWALKDLFSICPSDHHLSTQYPQGTSTQNMHNFSFH